MTRRKNTRPLRKQKRPIAYAHRVRGQYCRILTRLFEFMLASGAMRSDVRDLTALALAKASPRRVKTSDELSGYLSTAALILDTWHRDRRYLDADANPIAVPLTGSRRSVESIARGEPSVKKPAELARRLMRNHLVVRCGRGLYKPASSFALLTALDPVAIQHIVRSLNMLLDTIEANLAPTSPRGKLIERIAEVPDLPVKHVRAFREFTRTQGWELLSTVNDWLEARRSRTGATAQGAVHAGIHVHSYVGQPKARPSARKAST
jgi:hypothetical protein